MKRACCWQALLTMFAVVLLTQVGLGQPPEMPKPTKEHELLKQFAGEWETSTSMIAAPGEEPMTCQGSESAQMVGGFWLVIEGEVDMMGDSMTSILTVGYDHESKKYIGSFVCSVASTFWNYEGSFDESGKKLTLEAEGPSMLDPTKKAMYRDVIESKGKDHKVLTSYLQADDGTWVKFMTADGKRTTR